jgi:hypothetical protein
VADAAGDAIIWFDANVTHNYLLLTRVSMLCEQKCCLRYLLIAPHVSNGVDIRHAFSQSPDMQLITSYARASNPTAALAQHAHTHAGDEEKIQKDNGCTVCFLCGSVGA